MDLVYGHPNVGIFPSINAFEDRVHRQDEEDTPIGSREDVEIL